MSLFDNDDNVVVPPSSAITNASVVSASPEDDAEPEESSLASSTSPLDSAVLTASPSPTSSKSPTPPPTKGSQSKKKKKAPLVVQLIGGLPIAHDEALGTFTQLGENWYQSQKMGLSRETLESMQCDCTFKPDRDEPYMACGHNSDCINRLTQVECLPGDCRCKTFCQNQRFQKREYARIEVVKTELKGYGLRAEQLIERDTFIYEYIGDVVDDKRFKKRMRDYAEEGIKHFYFMMLQKDEFIDATKNGDIGRFANHSCNPNCYVAKWTIGKRVRMGIFAKRDIQQFEELTFDYNVDRYGHEAQVCHCGEPMCVGFIGGKTQTMSDDMLEALGVDEDELGEYKSTKKKRGKKFDDPDFLPTHEITQKEAPKVIQILRQTSSLKVLFKVLTRVKLTHDPVILRYIMRLRGLSAFNNILEDNMDNTEILTLALECLMTWPLTQRNKVEDSHIEGALAMCIQSTNETVKGLAEKLKAHWATLSVGYRIPKRRPEEVAAELEREEEKRRCAAVQQPAKPNSPGESLDWSNSAPDAKRLRYDDEAHTSTPPQVFVSPPTQVFVPPVKHYKQQQTFGVPRVFQPQPVRITVIPSRVNEVIAAATEAALAEEEARSAAVKAEAERVEAEQAQKEAKAKRRKERAERGEKKSSGSSKKHRERETPEQKEANKEKRLLKLVGAVVVKVMSKYSQQMDHDVFKKHAKELTQSITDKEKKSSSYKEGRLDALSEEKTLKIKKYAKEYIVKVLRKLDKAGQLKRPKQKGDDEAGPSSNDDALLATESIIIEDLAHEVDAQMKDDERADDSESDSEAEGDAEAGVEADPDVSMDVNMMPSMGRPPDSESPMEVDPPSYDASKGHKTISAAGSQWPDS